MSDISINLSYSKPDVRIIVNVVDNNQNLIFSDVCTDSIKININFAKNMSLSKIDIILYCNDYRIRTYPVCVNEIVLDDFYRHKKLKFTKDYNYDYSHCQWANIRNIMLTKELNNALFFTGSMTYSFIWPFFLNQFLFS